MMSVAVCVALGVVAFTAKPSTGWLMASTRTSAATTVRRTIGPSSTMLQSSLSSAESYLSTLSSIQLEKTELPVSLPPTTIVQPTAAAPAHHELQHPQPPPSDFYHATFSDFDISKLTPKGPRTNPDVGQPHDATKKLAQIESLRAGSWWCAEGGWPSPKLRATTEVFFVISGRGCVTDTDGVRHEFGVGDTVILPKGWSGRWDIMEAIHKVWFVHDHPRVEDTNVPIRAVVTSCRSLIGEENLQAHGVLPGATYGFPNTASQTIYNTGVTKVGSWSCTPGSFPVVSRATGFHVLDGLFFLTSEDGVSKRCVGGDTVMLPKGWKGQWDIVETVKKLWVVVEP